MEKFQARPFFAMCLLRIMLMGIISTIIYYIIDFFRSPS